MLGDRVGGGEGEPDRRGAAEEVFGIRRGMLVADHLERRGGREKRPGTEGEVEGDHEAVLEAQRLLKRHLNPNPTRNPPPTGRYVKSDLTYRPVAVEKGKAPV